MLWNRNYLLRFRFRFWLLKSYGSGSGSGSDFWKVMVPVPVPVPTFEKVTVPVPAPYIDHKKQIWRRKKCGIFFDFLLSRLFYKEKVHKFQQIYGKIWMKKMLNEGNQMHNFMSSSGSGTVIKYGSGSDFWKIMVPFPTYEKLWFRFRFLLLKKLRFRFQLHI